MPELAWLEFALKLGSTAAVVVLTCLAVERAGPVLGGLIATLPISAGPTFVFLAMEHDSAFIGATALGGIRALTGTLSFIIVYGLVVPRWGLLIGLPAALAGWAATVTSPRPDSIWAGAAIFALVVTAGLLLLRRVRAVRPVLRGGSSRWDIPMRAVGAMVLVALALVLGRAFGPAAAGIAALAPIIMTSLGLMLYRRLGGAGAASVLANTLPGIMGNAFAVVALNRTAVPLGSALALSLALAICVAWNLGMFAFTRRRQRR